ncbi:MAG: PfkB family carbohydrate kinase, partial [Acholeplasmataceae bacterium]|nr:PfkB family carbohydrate kinase [Acholeplasmataceae bacterium]
IETIGALATRIAKASGLSTNIELIPMQKKIGGNGPIMCNALAMHQPSITYIGALGAPHIDDVFKEMVNKVNVYSLAINGHTDALEFHDGKLMLGKMAYLNDITYEKLLDVVGESQLLNLLSNANMLATVNWSMIPNMTDLWNKLIIHILPQLPIHKNKPLFFVDLADPEKRENEDIIDALNVLKLFNSHFNVILGLNKKEAFDIGNVLGVYKTNETSDHLKDLSQALYNSLGIYGVVIHPVNKSCITIENTYYEELGPYVSNPKLTTGAGDNFNAGLTLGLMLGLSPDEALLMGMSTSGYYVRNAKSPTYKELIEFIELWDQNLI